MPAERVVGDAAVGHHVLQVVHRLDAVARSDELVLVQDLVGRRLLLRAQTLQSCVILLLYALNE